jgi:hypothetical protein
MPRVGWCTISMISGALLAFTDISSPIRALDGGLLGITENRKTENLEMPAQNSRDRP